ncbi:hypothetical protein GGR16_003048 [Chelatococcus caeni]|uniref:Uncharacterized protein n=1 Tax=Chelatococcus caeni TaxID=1348468 RepID=A0A840BY31_9HYPH|nr:hypothetical protein [Chelatococcus caeni]MBB4018014.1 hypothetical protein [Chelatococcus caeni]
MILLRFCAVLAGRRCAEAAGPRLQALSCGHFGAESRVYRQSFPPE